MTKISTTERAEAASELRKLLKPGQTVYTIMRHCSASGMSRVIDLAIVVPDIEKVYPLRPADQAEYVGQKDYEAKPKKHLRGHVIRSIGWLAAKAMADNFDRDRQGIKIGGCGMDMGFALVYNLGSTIWPKGTPKPHGRRNGEPDSDGGYALKHVWL
jgi:hypothetical protein